MPENVLALAGKRQTAYIYFVTWYSNDDLAISTIIEL